MNKIYTLLLEHYSPQGWWPIKGKYKESKHKSKSPAEQFEIAIGAILTQNTSWTNVEKALTELRKNKLLSKKAIKEQRTVVSADQSGLYYRPRFRAPG